MYAITGITGKVGGALARTLLAGGQPVRAVLRDARKGRSWAEKGCEVSHAEMEDVAALGRPGSWKTSHGMSLRRATAVSLRASSNRSTNLFR